MPDTIRLGQCFYARFTKRDLVVRIEDTAPDGGWIARSLAHGRKVFIKSVGQILYRCDENGLQTVADDTIPNRRSKAVPPVKKEPQIVPFSVLLPLPTGPLALLEAAAFVLRESKAALSTREIIAMVVQRKLWEPTGATPWGTLNAALNRDIQANGTQSQFKKRGRGQYTLR
jgi:hypothetical protein